MVIIAIGSIVLAFSNTDILTPIAHSTEQTSAAISKAFSTNTTNATYLNRSQNLDDIVIEGTVSDENTRTLYGSDIVKKGETIRLIVTTTELGHGTVIITPTSPYSGTYYVKNEKNGFTLHLSEAQQSDFSFNWVEIFAQLPVDKLPQ